MSALSEMSHLESFALFQALPPELRMKIWSDALSERTVWAAVSRDSGGCSSWAMAYVGQAPYLAGLACRESRRLLEKLYTSPLRGPGLATSFGACWVNLESTVVYLGSSYNATELIEAFSVDGLARFRHVALQWYQFDRLARTCQRLAETCPALRTIIIQRGESGDITSESVRDDLDPDLAAYYATIPGSVDPETSHDKLDVSHFRSLLLEYFGDSPPRICLVPTSSANF